MRRLLLLIPLLTSCTSIRFVHTDHGQILDNQNRQLSVIGRPRMTCYDTNGLVVADGYFLGQTARGSFLIDEYGKKFVLVLDPICRVGNNE